MSVETYQFPNHLTIRNIAELHHGLLSQLDACQSLEGQVPSDAEIDISFLQLLESARLYALSARKSFSLSEPANDTLLDTLTRCGWLQADGKGNRGFWLHEGGKQ